MMGMVICIVVHKIITSETTHNGSYKATSDVMLANFQTSTYLQEKPLNLALMYRDDGHICKQDPFIIAQFYMESSRMTNIFRGFLLTEMHIVKHLPPPSQENQSMNLQQTLTMETLVEIKCHENQESNTSKSKVEAKVPFNCINT